jgi:hypothetical protein
MKSADNDLNLQALTGHFAFLFAVTTSFYAVQPDSFCDRAGAHVERNHELGFPVQGNEGFRL